MKRFIIVLGDLKHGPVGLKDHLGAVALGVPHHLHGLGHIAAGKLHLIDLPVFVDPHLQPLAQGVDHAGAHAVQAAGDLIAPSAELSARMKDGKDHLQGGLPGLLLDIHRDTAAVVHHRDDIPLGDLYGDLVAVPGQRLVDGVVHDLIYQMVQSALRGGADIHARALADGLKPLQHLDLGCAVLMLHLGGAVFKSFRHQITSIGISGGQRPPLQSVVGAAFGGPSCFIQINCFPPGPAGWRWRAGKDRPPARPVRCGRAQRTWAARRRR